MTYYVVKPLDANTWDAFSRLVEDVRALQRHMVPLLRARLSSAVNGFSAWKLEPVPPQKARGTV